MVGVVVGCYGVDLVVFKVLFLGFMFVFVIKVLLWLFYCWLLDVVVEFILVIVVLMMVVMDKVGIFGMLCYCL